MVQTAKEARPLNVLFVSRKYPPAVGGIERYSADLIETCEADKIFSITLSGSQLNLVWWIPFALIKTIWLTVRYQVDVLHLTDCLLVPFFIPFKTPLRVVVVATAHGLDVTWGCKAYQWLLRKSLPKVDVVVAVSNKTKAECLARHVEEARLHIIPNGIRTAPSIPEEVARGHILGEFPRVPANPFILLYVGRLVPRKNLAWFVDRVFPQLSPEFLLLIIGDGPERLSVEAAILTHSLQDRIKLLGEVSDVERNLAYAGSDVLIVPNRKVSGNPEGFGIVTIEAGSFGLPVVVSRVDGLEDAVVEGRSGIFVEEGDVAGFTEALQHLQTDSTLREKLSQSAIEVVEEKFHWATLSRSYLQIYNSLAAQKKGQGS